MQNNTSISKENKQIIDPGFSGLHKAVAHALALAHASSRWYYHSGLNSVLKWNDEHEYMKEFNDDTIDSSMQMIISTFLPLKGELCT